MDNPIALKIISFCIGAFSNIKWAASSLWYNLLTVFLYLYTCNISNSLRLWVLKFQLLIWRTYNYICCLLLEMSFFEAQCYSFVFEWPCFVFFKVWCVLFEVCPGTVLLGGVVWSERHNIWLWRFCPLIHLFLPNHFLSCFLLLLNFILFLFIPKERVINFTTNINVACAFKSFVYHKQLLKDLFVASRVYKWNKLGKLIGVVVGSVLPFAHQLPFDPWSLETFLHFLQT